MAKKAPVEIVRAQTVCPGKYIVMIRGDEESVRDSMDTGVHYAGQYLVDKLVIPNLHEQIIPALLATRPMRGLDAVGILETFSAATCIVAADAACKAAQIELIEIRLANGLGGKAYVTLSVDQYSVEAAVAAGVATVDSGYLLRSEIIPAPHADLAKVLL